MRGRQLQRVRQFVQWWAVELGRKVWIRLIAYPPLFPASRRDFFVYRLSILEPAK
jgi:hypothetical protein